MSKPKGQHFKTPLPYLARAISTMNINYRTSSEIKIPYSSEYIKGILNQIKNEGQFIGDIEENSFYLESPFRTSSNPFDFNFSCIYGEYEFNGKETTVNVTAELKPLYSWMIVIGFIVTAGILILLNNFVDFENIKFISYWLLGIPLLSHITFMFLVNRDHNLLTNLITAEE